MTVVLTAKPTASSAPRTAVAVTYPAPGRPASLTGSPGEDARTALGHWIRSQKVNAERGKLLLRPFTDKEFGTSAASPMRSQVHAVNRLVVAIRAIVERNVAALNRALTAKTADLRGKLDRITTLKDENSQLVSQTEKIWHFYWNIFSQRLTAAAPKLLAADRVALDCYQYVYQGLGRARSIPSPAPFSYLEAGFGPATYRRGVKLAKLGYFPNPFPLVKLPDHRLVCPWTLGAIPHEVAHNLQADLGLWFAIPRQMALLLKRAGIPRETARVWVRWQKEIVADLMGVLLIGPAYAGSLMDVVGKSPVTTVAWNAEGVHPTPFLRVLINLELIRRLGFVRDARAIRRAWFALYPPDRAITIPISVRRQFVTAMRVVVTAICDTPYPQLGMRRLRDVVTFRPQDQIVAVEAAYRLARGADPGIIPERFMLSAVRYAFDHRLASPETLARNFYESLARR